jgi:hypothetical protein
MTSGQHQQDTRVPTWRTKASATPPTPPTSVLFVFFVLFVANFSSNFPTPKHQLLIHRLQDFSLTGSSMVTKMSPIVHKKT